MRVLLFRVSASIALSLTGGALSSSAQQPVDLPELGAEGSPPQLVDRVVAVVGDSAIFYSQVQERREMMRAQGAPVPPPQDSAALREFEGQIVRSLVDQAVVLRAASRDTLAAIPEPQLDERFQQAWDEEISRFGSEAEFATAVEAEFGIPLSQYRSEQRENLRRQLLLSSFVELQRQETQLRPVDEAEVRAFFEQERERFGQRPATITFQQVSLAPQASDSARAAAREEAERILEMLREGEDFADLARRFSEDPGSAPRGGELGWVRQGTMVEAFEDIAFQLRRGQISGVVETGFGAHIIRVERISGPERLVHHILIAAEPTAADGEAARQRATAVRDSVAAGAPIGQFRTDSDLLLLPDSATLARDQLGQLPENLAGAFEAAEEGDVLGPIEVPTPQGTTGFMVLSIPEIREAGAYPYEDVREQIREQLQREQFENRLVERLRSETYVDVRW